MLKLLDRWSRNAVIAVLLLLPIAIYAAVHIPLGSAEVHKWLPDGRVERLRYERFLNLFGTDQFVLISWEGCKHDDPRLTAFKESLEKETTKSSDVDAGTTVQPLLAEVQSTLDVVDSLTAEPLSLSRSQAARRLKNVLVGEDGTCAVVARVSPYGLDHQSNVIELLYNAADEIPLLGRDQLRIAGTIYEAYSVDQAAEKSLRQLVLPSSIIGIGLACVCLRSLWAAGAVLIMAGVGQLFAIATVYYTGGQFSAVLIVLPTLVFMLTLSSAVHLMNYYVDVSATHSDHLGSRAMLLGFKPSILASLTTALGMASLSASQLSPVREFGIYSSTTLCVATVFLLLAFPACSDYFYGPTAIERARKKRQSAAIEEPEESDPEPTSSNDLIHSAEEMIDRESHAAVLAPSAIAYAKWMERVANIISVCGFALILLSLWGLLYLQPSTKFDDMFPEDSRTITNMVWLEQHLGPISNVEVLLHYDKANGSDTYERLQYVDRICKAIRENQELGTAISATTFLPEFPQTSSLRSVAQRSVLRKSLPDSLPLLRKSGWVAEDDTGEVWRITAKVSATSKEDFGVLTDRVAKCVQDTIGKMPEHAPDSVEFTGLTPVMHDTQLTLIDDLQISFTAAFVLITPVMMIIARGFWAGLLIMIPNVLPETLVFGMMAWLGFRLDIAGLLTASVAMGIAVNDTLHFVNWYAHRLSSGDSRPKAIADTLTCCAGAMFHTMLISCCSMLPFVFADFLPTRQFAFLMIAMLSSALLGDLVLLPALLLSPLGKCLMPKNYKETSSLKAEA